MKLTVIKNISNKNNRIYYAVVIDLGYAKKYLSFDKYICMELLGKMLGKNPREIEEMPCGEYTIIEKGE